MEMEEWIARLKACPFEYTLPEKDDLSGEWKYHKEFGLSWKDNSILLKGDFLKVADYFDKNKWRLITRHDSPKENYRDYTKDILNLHLVDKLYYYFLVVGEDKEGKEHLDKQHRDFNLAVSLGMNNNSSYVVTSPIAYKELIDAFIEIYNLAKTNKMAMCIPNGTSYPMDLRRIPYYYPNMKEADDKK